MNKDKILANILADSELACLPDIFLRLNTLNQGKPTYIHVGQLPMTTALRDISWMKKFDLGDYESLKT